MKKILIKIVSILLLVFLFVNCKSTQTEASDVTVVTNKNDFYLIEWKDQYYYVEGKEEIKKILKPFPKIPRLLKSYGYLLLSFNHDYYYATDTIYRVNKNKNVRTGRGDHADYYLEIDREKRTSRKNGAFIFSLPREEKIDEIFSKLKKPIIKEFKSTDHAQVRSLLNSLLIEEKVFCILNYDLYQKIDGYYKIYVPANSLEEVTGWRMGEFQRELQELYGQGFSYYGITIDSLPISWCEETHEVELTCHGPFEFYKRIEKYPKSEFKESSYEWTLTYFEIPYDDEEVNLEI